MRIIALWIALAGLGCALPKVVLGGRVALGRTSTGEPGAGRATVRSALWIAMVYAASTNAPETPRASDHAVPLLLSERAPEPCTIDIACAWEREAAYQAWIEEEGTSP